jgi:two-component system nitrogen regulation sensor histidine kinase NtrY
MVFRNFRVQVILRVLILTIAITLLAWCITHELYLRSVYIFVAVSIMVMEFISYVDRFNRDVKTFMTSILQRDFTTYYQSQGKGKSFDGLYDVLNRISYAFKMISKEKEIQHRYLEMLVDHLRVGILSIDAAGKIYLANKAMKDLLQRDFIQSLKTLESVDAHFVKSLREIRTGETRLVKLQVGTELLHLSLHASEFKLEDQYYKLISMQNIRTELDAREMESWQKLIRVLSHEIMNSVSPIISLSGTLHDLVTQKNKDDFNRVDDSPYHALDKGLEAIKIRSEGLYNFTQAYRKLTGIPKLALKLSNVRDIVQRVLILMQPRIAEQHIQLLVGEMDIEVMVDPELMEHVLINLLLNAIDALSGKEGACIQLRTSKNPKGNNCIHVIDNGEGMDDNTRDKIFIPFFTTRKNGSGIGLALTKQILQLHQADILFQTEYGKGTEFTIVL